MKNEIQNDEPVIMYFGKYLWNKFLVPNVTIVKEVKNPVAILGISILCNQVFEENKIIGRLDVKWDSYWNGYCECNKQTSEQ